MGTGGGNTPLLLVAEGVDTYNQCLTGDKAKTLLAGHIDADGVPCVALNILQDAVPNEKVAPCLSTGNPKTGQANLAVCMPYILLDDQGGEIIRSEINAEKSPTLRAQDHGHPPCLCLPTKIPALYQDKIGSLCARDYKAVGNQYVAESKLIVEQLLSKPIGKWIVRRVTPTECARLQGMPDWWCGGVAHKDAPEYKMWGNGMALPCVLFVMQGIAKQLRKQLLQKIGGAK